MDNSFDLNSLIRPNILNLKPYRSARDDFDSGILLDANENSIGAPFENDLELHRYPMPYQEELRSKINFISYDRVGYGANDTGKVQASIAFERDLLKDLVKDIPKDKLVFIGYSYGGPIALALNEKINKLILLAPAVYSEVEPMPWMLHFYKWKATRWLVPKTWMSASKEKLTHKEDLRKFENNWKDNPNEIIAIHGLEDGIVPFSNSEYFIKLFCNYCLTAIFRGTLCNVPAFA